MSAPLPRETELEEARLESLNARAVFYQGYAACELQDRETSQTITLALGKTEAQARASAIEIATAMRRLETQDQSDGWRVRAYLEKHPISIRFCSDKYPEGLRSDSPDLPLDLQEVACELLNVLQGRVPPLELLAEFAKQLEAAAKLIDGGDSAAAVKMIRAARSLLFTSSRPFGKAL